MFGVIGGKTVHFLNIDFGKCRLVLLSFTYLIKKTERALLIKLKKTELVKVLRFLAIYALRNTHDISNTLLNIK